MFRAAAIVSESTWTNRFNLSNYSKCILSYRTLGEWMAMTWGMQLLPQCGM
jgi:hypothetical protein